MPNYTDNYSLVIPLVADNVPGSTIPLLGSSNVVVDSQIKSLHDEDVVLDDKIDNQGDTLNNRIDNLILHSAPLPEVAAQEVYDARYSPVYDITYAVLTNRITAIEESIVALPDINDYITINRAGGIV